jgi:hypothetical protein
MNSRQRAAPAEPARAAAPFLLVAPSANATTATNARAERYDPRSRRIHPMKSRYHRPLRFSDRRCVR